MKNPGWVDLQVNGHNGIDYTDPNLTAEDFIRSAEELLKTGIFSVSEISESLGYSSLAYFSTTFKKVTGISPSEYIG